MVQDAHAGEGRFSDLFAADELVDTFRPRIGCLCASEFCTTLSSDPPFWQLSGRPKQWGEAGVTCKRVAAKVRLASAVVVNPFPEVEDRPGFTGVPVKVADLFVERKTESEVQPYQDAAPSIHFLA
jgi:hypothetical protein